ncbi:MAG: hypothetical protein QOE80_4363 [Actinomycetota bacterium]|jgi:hypothetical protein|nr:hypothetical protein [Actinomycetota bacterium]
MMPEDLSDTLNRARRDAMLSIGALWLRYFELGGMGTAIELEAYLYGALRPSAAEYDVIAQALNERFVQLGGIYTIPFSDD